MKYFRMSYEEVVFRRSYLNLVLLNASIPGHKPYGEEEKSEDPETNKIPQKEIHANDYFINFM